MSSKNLVELKKEDNYFDNFENVFDYWSQEQIDFVKNKLSNRTNEDLVRKVQGLIELKEKLKSFKSDFYSEKDSSSGKIIPNVVPYGEKSYKMITLDAINNATDNFIILFKNAYYKDYKKYSYILQENQFTDKFKNSLRTLYESFLCYPRIRLDSVGFGSISRITDLFQNLYLNGNFTPRDFYAKFLENTFYNIYYDLTPDSVPEDLENFEKEYFYELRKELWFDVANSNSNSYFKNIGKDSYGIFFQRPDLLETGPQIQTSSTSSRGSQQVFRRISLPVNEFTGSVDLSSKKYTFDPVVKNLRTSLLLFSRYKEGTDPKVKFFDERKTVDIQDQNTYFNQILQYYYNYNPTDERGQSIIKQEAIDYSAEILRELNITNVSQKLVSRWIIDLQVPTSSYSTQASTTTTASKKKYDINDNQLSGSYVQNSQITQYSPTVSQIKSGGSKSQLFDISQAPSIYSKRKNLKLDRPNFNQILQEYGKLFSNFNESIEKGLEKIYGYEISQGNQKVYLSKLSNIPLFYNGPRDSRVTNRDGLSNSDQQLTYTDLRKILVFCNVVSNNFKMVRQFFDNYRKCINFVKSKIPTSSNNNKKNTSSRIFSGIDKLVKSIETAISILDVILTDKDNLTTDNKTGVEARNLFLGIDLDYLKKINGESLTSIVNNYIFYTNKHFEKDKFVNLLRKIGTWKKGNDEVILGGYSLVSKKDNELNKIALNGYYLSIIERSKSNDNLITSFNNYVNDSMIKVSNSNKNNILAQLGGDLIKLMQQQERFRLILEYFLKMLSDNLQPLVSDNRNYTNGIKNRYSFDPDIYDKNKVRLFKKLNEYKLKIKFTCDYLKDFLKKTPQVDKRLIDIMLYKLNLMAAYQEFFVKSNTVFDKAQITTLIDKLKSYSINIPFPDITYQNTLNLFNPNYDNPQWWFEMYNKFQWDVRANNSTKYNKVNKIFMFLIVNQNSKLEFYLVDVFAAAFSRNMNNVVKENIVFDNDVWAKDNVFIKLSPFADEESKGIDISQKLLQLSQIMEAKKKLSSISSSQVQSFSKQLEAQIELFLKDAFKSYIPIINLIGGSYKVDFPYLNALETPYNDERLPLNMSMVITNTNDKYKNIFFNRFAVNQIPDEYPVFYYDSTQFKNKNGKEMFGNILSNAKDFRKYAYASLLSLSDPTKSIFLRDLKTIPITFGPNKDSACFELLMDLFKKIYISSIIKLQSRISSGLLSKEFIIERLMN